MDSMSFVAAKGDLLAGRLDGLAAEKAMDALGTSAQLGQAAVRPVHYWRTMPADTRKPLSRRAQPRRLGGTGKSLAVLPLVARIR
jgi:hypothetical protein